MESQRGQITAQVATVAEQMAESDSNPGLSHSWVHDFNHQIIQGIGYINLLTFILLKPGVIEQLALRSSR